MSEDEFKIAKFIVFCLEAFKTTWEMSGSETEELFEKYGVVDYLEEGYDLLHSLGEQALVADIVTFLKVRGLTFPK